MEKTIREWFELLPTDIRNKAISNTKPHLLETTDFKLYTAICGVFNWNESPEGHDFWEEIEDRAGKGEFDIID